MSLSNLYPTIQPSLMLDFANSGALDPRITFTRASSGTYFGPDGVLYTAQANAPRFDYSPSTLAAQGLLIEESRTNLCIYSEDFTYANWLVTNGTKTTGVSDPWGGSTAATLTATNTSATFQNAAATVVIGTTYTVSCWMRRRTGTGAVGIRAVENANTPVTITNTWARYSLTVTAAQTIGRAGVYVQTSGDEIDVWGFQLEAGAFPTSYIPTTTIALTRAADAASVNTLSPWYNAAEGTVYAEVITPTLGSFTSPQAACSFNDTTGNNRFTLAVINPTRQGSALRNTAGAGLLVTNTTNTAVDGLNKLALGVSTGASVVLNGGTAATTTTYGMPTVTQVQLGWQLNASYVNGHLRRITYYPRRLSDAELVAITS